MSVSQTESIDVPATPLLDQLSHLGDWMRERGHTAFRTRQVIRWIFDRRTGCFADMSDLPKPLRTELARFFALFTSRVETHQICNDGTEKLVLRLSDGGLIECVLLREADRRTICVSSQVGCAMGCVFCASGLDGVMRNLTSGEVLEQMLLLQQLLAPGDRLSHIVMMGMGRFRHQCPARYDLDGRAPCRDSKTGDA
jgi:23S rRNA (adenine2503-C2)-methyltransferase